MTDLAAAGGTLPRMGPPVQDFGRVVKQLFRVARIVSYGAIGLMVFLLAFRVADVTRSLAGVHPLLGGAFLLALVLALTWFIGRPLHRFFRLPVVMRAPRIPEMAKRTPRDLARHLEYVARYVESLPTNPEWSGEASKAVQTAAACRALGAEASGSGGAALAGLVGRAVELERAGAELLAPLDRKAADVIRAEAFRVGVATAVSPYGTLDAFLVLWRNVNLVAHVAQIYYGRPSPRGTLRVVRDVSVATIAGAYLQDLGEVAGDFLGSLAGKTAGFFAGPLMEGCLNGVATMRIGYLAKARCRAFQAWNERTAGQAVREALVEAGRFTTGLVGDLVRAVGGGLLRLPGKILGGLVDRLSALFSRSPTPDAPGADAAG